MTARFEGPVSDTAEASLRAEAVPNNTSISLLQFGVFVFGMNGLRIELPRLLAMLKLLN